MGRVRNALEPSRAVAGRGLIYALTADGVAQEKAEADRKAQEAAQRAEAAKKVGEARKPATEKKAEAEQKPAGAAKQRDGSRHRVGPVARLRRGGARGIPARP